MLVPTRRGTLADHAVKPATVTEAPRERVHLTAATPVASLAVPSSLIEELVVETIVAPGLRMRSAGGVMSLAVGVTGAGCGGSSAGSVGIGAGAGTGWSGGGSNAGPINCEGLP